MPRRRSGKIRRTRARAAAEDSWPIFSAVARLPKVMCELPGSAFPRSSNGGNMIFRQIVGLASSWPPASRVMALRAARHRPAVGPAPGVLPRGAGEWLGRCCQHGRKSGLRREHESTESGGTVGSGGAPGTGGSVGTGGSSSGGASATGGSTSTGGAATGGAQMGGGTGARSRERWCGHGRDGQRRQERHGRSGKLGGPPTASGGAGGSTSPGTCQKGQIKPAEVVIMGESFYAIAPNTSRIGSRTTPERLALSVRMTSTATWPSVDRT